MGEVGDFLMVCSIMQVCSGEENKETKSYTTKNPAGTCRGHKFVSLPGSVVVV